MKIKQQQLLRVIHVVGLALLIAYHVLHVLAWPTRLDWPNADESNYVDVARNILHGRGAVQNTLGFNQPRGLNGFGTFPSPLEAQPPLFPYAIAGLAWLTGLPVHGAGIVLPAVAHAVLGATLFALARTLAGWRAGMLATAFGVLAFEARGLAAGPHSEIPATVLLFGALTALIQLVRPRGGMRLAVACGVLSGLAIAMRYAFVVFSAYAVLVLCVACWRGMARPSWVILFLGGLAMVLGPLLARNLLVLGVLLPGQLPSNIGVVGNFINMAGWYVVYAPLFLLILTASAWELSRGSLPERLRGLLIEREAWIVTAWVAVYFVFILLQRSRIHFEPIGLRILFPSSMGLLVMMAVVLERGLLRRVPALASALALNCCALVLITYAPQYFEKPPQAPMDIVQQRPDLAWLAANTSERDLIVGINSARATFYLDRTHVFSFAAHPYNERLTYEDLRQFLGMRCAQFDRAALYIDDREILEAPNPDVDFGPFVMDMHNGNVATYPRLTALGQTGTVRLYEFRACP